MRKLFAVVVAAVLLPIGAAAQDTPSGEHKRPTLTEQQARTAAVARVRGDLAAGKLNTWGMGTGGGIRPTDITVSRTLLLAKGGKDGGPVYLVFASARSGKGQVRVALNAQTGAVLNVVHRDFAGRATPDWWTSRAEPEPEGEGGPGARR